MPDLPHMIIPTTNDFTFEVTFSEMNREPGFRDDIRVAMSESGSPNTRILKGDRCSILLTVDEAERLARALLQAAAASRLADRPGGRTERSTEPPLSGAVSDPPGLSGAGVAARARSRRRSVS